jgi:hypothetical protein
LKEDKMSVALAEMAEDVDMDQAEDMVIAIKLSSRKVEDRC